MKKIISVFMLFLVGLLAISAVSAATPLDDKLRYIGVEVNDVSLSSTDARNLEKTEELDVIVMFSLNESTDDVRVQVELTGYDNSDKSLVEDETDLFDVKANQVYDKKLTLKLPVRFEQGEYSIKVRIDDKTDSITVLYPVWIDAKSNLIEIKDIVLSPENEVEAGRALLTTVRIKNRGEQAEEDVKIKVSIPALGISASDYIDELDEEDGTDDSTTSEELYMRIPENAESGDYTVKVEVTFDDGDETETATTTIKIISAEGEGAATPAETTKTIITAGPSIQDVARGGAGVVYPVTISNAGTNAKTYTISADGADWAEFRISPTNVVTIAPGESKAIYVYLSAKETATAGENSFAVTIKSGETVLKEVSLKANVTAAATSSWSKIKRALEIGLVVLVVLLVILGLIIGFNKLKGSEEEGEGKEDSQTYY